MTLTLEISPEVEAELMQAATSAGRELPVWIVEAAREKAAQDQESGVETEAQRRKEAAFAALGMFAGRGRTVDDFLADRRAEAELEMEQAENRHQMRAANTRERGEASG